MQIAQVQVGNILYPLVEGEPLPIAVGETIRIFYSFSYRMPSSGSVKIWASLYNYSPGYFDRKEAAQTKGAIVLEKALVFTPHEGAIDIVIGDISSGIYGLILELPDYEDTEGNPIEDKIEDCLEVTAPPGIMEMISPLLMIGLMVGMIAIVSPMMREGV